MDWLQPDRLIDPEYQSNSPNSDEVSDENKALIDGMSPHRKAISIALAAYVRTRIKLTKECASTLKDVLEIVLDEEHTSDHWPDEYVSSSLDELREVRELCVSVLENLDHRKRIMYRQKNRKDSKSV